MTMGDPVNALRDQTAKDIEQLIQILPAKNHEQVYKDVQGLVGMDKVKGNMLTFIRRNMLNKRRQQFNMKSSKGSYHTVLYGNSGTGKTTVAKHRAELMHSLGLAGPKFLSLTRENLVGQFIGHTEERVKQIVDAADQIFIDEAYALSRDSSQDFGSIIIDALMTRLENDRDNLVVTFAGYTEEMDKFLSSNPGFKSRISYFEDLPDYSIEELGKILELKLEADEFIIEADAKDMAMEDMDKLKKKVGNKHFGNARVSRNIAEQAPDKMADRLFPDAFAAIEQTSLAETFNETIDELTKEGKITCTKSGIYIPGEGFNLEKDVIPAEALELKTVTLADIQALNIQNMNVRKAESRSIGFGTN